MEDKILIFTDLDGTLLSENSYSYYKIIDFYNYISSHCIIIFNSSKTYSEIIELKRLTNDNYPFIVENGSALYIPESVSLNITGKITKINNFNVVQLGVPVNKIVNFCSSKKLSEKYVSNCNFLYQMSLSEIVSLTGLSRSEVKKAKERNYSLPFIWRGSIELLNEFKLICQKNNFKILKGGRFFHLIGETDKGKALRALLSIYKQCHKNTRFTTIALGDNQNDKDMLIEADFAGIVKSESKSLMNFRRSKNVFISEKISPEGWKEVLVKMPPIKNLL